MNQGKRLASFVLAVFLLMPCLPARAADDACSLAAQAVLRMAPSPVLGTSGGEWAVFGLARWGGTVPEGYFEGYIERMGGLVAQCEGVLHERKYTEYSRTVLALTALGQDVRNFGGYDLLEPLFDVDKVTYQGVNGAIYALLALDFGGYEAPEGVCGQYVRCILDAELPGGGFALAGEVADPDVTAMALQALAPRQDDAQVSAAVQRGVARLSAMQKPTGGYEGWGSDSCESVSQVIIALTQLGIALDDGRFVKNGVSLMDNLLSYQLPDGSFSHTPGGKTDQIATEQALMALAAVQRVQQGSTPLYTAEPVSLQQQAGRAVRAACAALQALLGLL